MLFRNGFPDPSIRIAWRQPSVSYLVNHPNQLVRKDELLENVWGPEYTNGAGYVRVYMSQIHQKLEEDSSAPRYFLTEPGLGHRFVLGS